MKKNNIANNSINVVWIGVLAIILAIASPWFDLSVSNHSFVKTYVGGIGIGILVLFTLVKQYRNYDITYHISYLKLSLGATFALGVLSVFWSVNPDFSITKLLIWVTAIMAFYTAYKLNITEDNLHTLSFYLIIAGGLIAAIGILQYLFDPFALTQAANPSSTFGNKNMATQPISMIFPLVAFIVLNKKSSFQVMWIAAILGALMLTFNFYTSTRASWIAILVEVILMSSLLIIKRKSFHNFASWNKQKAIIVITAVVVFIALINFNEHGFHPMWEKAGANFERLTTSIQNDKSLRYQIWTVAGQMIADAPFFGTGLGSWFHNLVNEGYSTHTINYVQRVHNDLLELAVEIGIIGLFIFFLGVIAIVWAIWAIILKADNKYLLFYFALFESLTGSFANLQFSFPYQLAMPALLFGLYIGLIAKKSEEFIKPIKVWNLDLEKSEMTIYKKLIMVINMVIFVVMSSIYASWANMYSSLNTLNVTRDFGKLSLVETPIYHLEIQNIMNFLTFAYLQAGQYDTAQTIVKQMLKYWPNDYVTHGRYIHTLYGKKQYNFALAEFEKSKLITPVGFYNNYFIALDSYFKTRQYQKYIDTYKELASKDTQDLLHTNRTLGLLISSALRLNVLHSYAPKFYNLYKEKQPYNCGIENNYLVYLSYQEDKNTFKKAYENEIKNPRNCMNKGMINKIKSLK